MENTFNLTKFPATPDQLSFGVVDLPVKIAAEIYRLTYFQPIPTFPELVVRADEIVKVLQTHARNHPTIKNVMVNVPNYLSPILDKALKESGFTPCYPFIIRREVKTLNKTQMEYKFVGLVHSTNYLN